MVFRRYAVVYVLWIALCAILFFALARLEDPSRPKGRILSLDAGNRAIAILRARGMRDYEVVHVGRARAGEGGREERWVVLCDRIAHTGLKAAVVVELRVTDGSLIAVRSPR